MPDFQTQPEGPWPSSTKNYHAWQQCNGHQNCKQYHQTTKIEGHGNENFWGWWQGVLDWYPKQENLANYQRKHYPGAHHTMVQPYYLHKKIFPLELLCAVMRSTLKGFIGILRTSMNRMYPCLEYHWYRVQDSLRVSHRLMYWLHPLEKYHYLDTYKYTDGFPCYPS